MDLSGHTRPFAVLGHPIGHSLSPVMHNAAITELGMDGVYLAFDVHPDRLMTVLPAMADMGFGGVNLTIPLKEVAFAGIEDLDGTAQRVGAVNTVEFTDSGLRGHSTDGYGFLKAVDEAFGESVKGRAAFVLGTGGAGRAIAITLAVNEVSRLVLADIDSERASRVAAEIDELAPGVEVQVAGSSNGYSAMVRECDLVVQATPIGMKPGDVSLLDADCFGEGQMAFDMIYMFPETVFMKAAAQAGARTANGLGMLLHQGARAFDIWTGTKPPVETMRAALARAVYGKAD